MTPLSFRQLFALGFLACAGGMGFALYLEHGRGLEPCPLCIFQRIAMVAAGLVFLTGALHGPRGAGRWTYAALGALASGGGVGLAARHVWLQGLPPDQVPACGPTLDYLLGMLPLQDVVQLVLKGDGECAKIAGSFLGVSLPGWTLIAFAGLALLALAAPILARRGISQGEIP
jgi:disulfide bond formation protein DsbB